jgi:carbon storage regulator
MLVIRRHPGESILIGEDIELEVIECGHNRVKLGIRAPRQVTVLRSEVKLTRDENLAAARSLAAGTIPSVLTSGSTPVSQGAAGGAPIPLLGGRAG